MLADPFDVVHDHTSCVMARLVLAIHGFASLEQAVDARVKPVRDKSET